MVSSGVPTKSSICRKQPLTHMHGLTMKQGTGLRGKFLDHVFLALRDRQLNVRVCAADALSECVKILMERQPNSMTAPLCNLYEEMMHGLAFEPGGGVDGSSSGEKKILGFKNSTSHDVTAAINAHGSLLAVSTFLDHSAGFIMPREL